MTPVFLGNRTEASIKMLGYFLFGTCTQGSERAGNWKEARKDGSSVKDWITMLIITSWVARKRPGRSLGSCIHSASETSWMIAQWTVSLSSTQEDEACVWIILSIWSLWWQPQDARFHALEHDILFMAPRIMSRIILGKWLAGSVLASQKRGPGTH